VEHDEDTMRAADYIVDVGPGAGIHGGEIVAQGSIAEIEAEPRSITGQYLSGQRSIPVPARRRPGSGKELKVCGCRENNLQGIDVSEHQGTIDWQAVADAGYRFAFIRVGYRGYGEAGTLQEDAMAVENLRGAKEAGLFVGTYFFSQALNEKEASEEASLAVSVIEKSGVEPDLPLMYDPELIRDDQGRANEITRDQVALNTKAFRETVEASSSCRADIYSNLPWEHHYFDTATMNSFDIWYADYEPLPQTPYHFTWWQYTNEGTVPGIEGVVDLYLWLRKK
jgi:GH25 family lysozyme M1 (1,4-beta-N-acetylmuramidase)